MLRCGVVALAALAVACYRPASTTIVSQPQRLAQVSAIYVDNLGGEDGADLVREKIRLELMRTGRFTVVERPEAADAILRGTAGVASPQHQGTTEYSGTGVLRLVDRSGENTSWVFEYKPSIRWSE